MSKKLKLTNLSETEMKKVSMVFIILFLFLFCFSFSYASLNDIYNSGKIKFVPDSTFGKGTEWNM